MEMGGFVGRLEDVGGGRSFDGGGLCCLRRRHASQAPKYQKASSTQSAKKITYFLNYKYEILLNVLSQASIDTKLSFLFTNDHYLSYFMDVMQGNVQMSVGDGKSATYPSSTASKE